MGRVMRSKPTQYVLALAIVAFLAGSFLFARVGENEAQIDAQSVAAPLAVLCTTDPASAARVGADCVQAAALAKDGTNGTDGIGVLGTSTADGRLVVAYSDGRTQDVGQVVGEDGKVGPDGRGIRGTTVTNGRLLVTFTDGASLDVGPVVGPAGRGIASLDGSTGRLLVTLTDGDVIDAGPLPEGPKGDQGDAGPGGAPAPVVQSVTRYYTDGSIERCVRDGGTDVDPIQRCERTPPPVVPTTPPVAPPTTEGG